MDVWGRGLVCLAAVVVLLVPAPAMMLGLFVLSLFALFQRPPPRFALRMS
jgi:hypothetical protein